MKRFGLVLILLVMLAVNTYGYPPDNAAVLYYKAAMRYEVDLEMSNMLNDCRRDVIDVNDQIREFVKKNRLIIDTVVDATEVKNCDWGMDFSQGIEMEMPPLAGIRKLVVLVLAEGKIFEADGDYEAAIGHYMAVYRMARHVNDRVYISYLVGVAVESLANGCVEQLMSEMPQDMQHLTYLKNQLIDIESIGFSVKPAHIGEREAMLEAMTLENISEIVRFCDADESVKKKLLALDQAGIDRNKEHFSNYFAGVIAGFDMPYEQGYAKLKGLTEKIENDKSNPDAILARVLAPATQKIFSIKTRVKTHSNAIKAAIEVYLIKAETGKLPEELPAGLAKDMFSGKDFEYEKTTDGFILRCQGKDLGKDELYEYSFKAQ